MLLFLESAAFCKCNWFQARWAGSSTAGAACTQSGALPGGTDGGRPASREPHISWPGSAREIRSSYFNKQGRAEGGAAPAGSPGAPAHSRAPARPGAAAHPRLRHSCPRLQGLVPQHHSWSLHVGAEPPSGRQALSPRHAARPRVGPGPRRRRRNARAHRAAPANPTVPSPLQLGRRKPACSPPAPGPALHPPPPHPPVGLLGILCCLAN